MEEKESISRLLDISPLFQDLEPEGLNAVLERLRVETYPKGSLIYQTHGQESEGLRIVMQGAVKVTVPLNKNSDALVDYRGKGDALGFLSLLGAKTSGGEAVALEDTTCYVLERDNVFDLLKGQPEFARRFFTEFLQRYVSKPHRETKTKTLLYGGGERLLFTTPVGELVKRELVTAPEDLSIKKAAALMSTAGVGSLALLNSLGLPTGIVTDRDFRDRVVSRGRDVEQPVKNIQSVSLVRVEASEHCIEALFKMVHYNIRHLLVVEGGRLKGMITDQDLLRIQGTSPVSLVQAIENQPSLEGLLNPAGRIQPMVGLFLQEGVKAAQILLIINEVWDRLFRRALELVEKRLGPPPLTYCFGCLGAAGRKEQAFMRPQCNAVIYADPPSEALAEASKTYFSALSSLTVETFKDLGFPLDPNGWEPCLCGPLGMWKERFYEWIKRADKKSVQASLPMFDLRVQKGDEALADELRRTVIEKVRQNETFINVMALNIVKRSPPITAFKKFAMERHGENKGRFDLEDRGILPLVDIVRLYALKEGITETSTMERLSRLKALSSPMGGHCQELEYSFQLMNGLCLQGQFDRWQRGSTAQAWIDPARLNKLEEKALKQIFSFIARLQIHIQERHEPTRI